jgi:hypothetical protein
LFLRLLKKISGSKVSGETSEQYENMLTRKP